MQLKNYYYWWNGIFTKEECEKIIQLGLSKVPETATTAGRQDVDNNNLLIPQNTKTKSELLKEGVLEKTYVRDSKVSWLYDRWIYDKLWTVFKASNKEAGWNFDIDWSEDIQFTVYENSGFYGFHSDGCSDIHGAYKRYIEGVTPGNKENKNYVSGRNKKNWIGKIRKLSITVNLSDPNDYEGGNLLMDFGEHVEGGNGQEEITKIRPQGSCAVFPSFINHCVTPVTKGTRYSLVLWALGRPFK